MIMRDYGEPACADAILHKMTVMPNGISLFELVTMAEAKGFYVKPVYLDWTLLQLQKLPLLAFVRGDHFVVIDRVEDEKIIVRDPALGRIMYNRDGWGKIWGGETIIFRN